MSGDARYQSGVNQLHPDRTLRQRNDTGGTVKNPSPAMPHAGPIGFNVARNIERISRDRGLSQRRLSAELERVGRPIVPLGVSRLLKGDRRVDVDELVALAEVLKVTPDILLAPPEASAAATAEVPDPLRHARILATNIEDLLAASGDPADREPLAERLDRAFRRVQIDVEELLAETRKP
jgi:transcriptional regulator with XRE-family HTH domain